MKINVEFDLTPNEFRQALGLPDIEAFQQSLLQNIQSQMESGADGYDPMSLMRPFLQQPMMQQGLSQGLANFGTYQQMMLDMLRQAGSVGTGKTSSNASEREPSTGNTSDGETAAKTAASSRSRSSKGKAE
ncbi:hypothetical protein [Vreelandella nanhaiensis]|uniref:Uncharacterized protein n=1 Tax=Vreelandella nanhaiensis TaxID=1258546 RepID=A0A433KK45_9GAMM|nr:hypothetical protein [Halomonas nanhaiensis]RUR29903.1 hypothetical protein ELY38_14855 [Halomonas nanhaiensis]